MKASLLLLLVASVTANFEEGDISNRRHRLAQRAQGRRLQEDDTVVQQDASNVQLTRAPTTGTTANPRVTPPKRPSASPASAAAKTDDVVTAEGEGADFERKAGGGKRAPATANLATSAPSYYPTYFPTSSSGKSRKVDLDNYDDDAAAKSGKSGGRGGGKSGKSSQDYCELALDTAWEANKEAGNIIADTKEDMKEQCNFDTTDTNKSPFAPNLACPFIYTPDTGFLDEKDDVIEYFENITGSNETGIAFYAFQKYCECEKGLNEKCAIAVPDIPPISDEKALDYCVFASIWNGDIELDLFDTLDSEVQECGCTFVGTEKEDVDVCPGLGLGDNFIDPTA